MFDFAYIANPNTYTHKLYKTGSEKEARKDIIKILLETKRFLIIGDDEYIDEFDEILKELNLKIIIITSKNNKKIKNNNLYTVLKTDSLEGSFILNENGFYTFGISLKHVGTGLDLCTQYIITYPTIVLALLLFSFTEDENQLNI